MRPIALSLSGLHSFREKQTVDFEKLCEIGVFGIFGPTGSGKSSILDAITLALYGKVERAANNTQGIMNHAENTLSVSFTFEIGQGSSKRRYRVERSYKRVDDVSIRTSVCRLIEIGETDIVLADRERDVTASVQRILGLTIDDFTRAVVLPQGKFAEFLSLRGSERRKMLERLFHLEKYGERLNQRLKENLQTAKAEANEIAAAQAELSATTEEEVEKAKHNRTAAALQFAHAEKRLKAAEQNYEKEKQIWEWQLEKKKILHQKSELEKQRPEILHLKKKLEKVEEAEKLQPYLLEWKKWNEAAAACEREYNEAAHALEQTENETIIAKKTYEEMREKSEKEIPRLIQQIERYKYAQELEKEVKHAGQEKSELRKAYAETKKQFETERLNLEKEKANLANQLKQLSKIEDEINACSIDAKERNRIQEAVFEKRQLEMLQQAGKKSEQEYANKKKAYSQHKQAYHAQLEQQERLKQHALTLFRAIEKNAMRFASLRADMEQHRKKMEREKERLQTFIEHEQMHALARELQAQLADGEPCPVCGSTTHQLKVSGRDPASTLDHEKKTLKRLERMIQNMNESEQSIAYELANLEQLAKVIAKHIEAESLGIESFDEEWEQKPIRSFEEKTADFQTALKMLQQDHLQINERVERFQHELQQLEHELSNSAAQMAASEEALNEAAKNHEEAVKTYEQHLLRWRTRYGDKSIETIEKEWAFIVKKDEQSTKLKQTHDEMKGEIEKQKSAIENCTETLNDLRVNLEIASTQIEQIELDYENKYKHLKAHVGDRSAAELLQETEQQIDALRKEEKLARTNLEEWEKKLEKLKRDKSSLQERLTQLRDRQTEAAKRWSDQLASSSFENAEQLEDYFKDAQEKERWTQTIAAFEARWNKIQLDLQRLAEQMGDSEMDESQWEAAQRRLNEAKQAYQEAFKFKSEADYHYKHVASQYERFAELEEERKKAQKLVNQLEKLASVFRGNAFVEFMAQEQLLQVTREASERLRRLTNQRYGLELNSDGGFVIRDDANGGVRRPISTLSGGETFLTSLALALSLSSHIQLRGKYPLEFFFLDEGFGTLDHELLETVITSLEKLHMENVSIGLISHVPELQARIARKLVVRPAEPSGSGSRLTMIS